MTLAPTFESPTRLDQFLPEMHEPFLERASAGGTDGEGSSALGAFLTLRFADRAADRTPQQIEALAYQARATRDYLRDLPTGPEVSHLREIVRVAAVVGRRGSRHLLCAPLLAFAYWLEQELRLEEALDVVDTARRIRDGLTASDVVATLLQRARILRLLGRFQEARVTYETARAKAAEIGDSHSILLGRIGDAIVARQLGNLRASENTLRVIVCDAHAAGDRDAEARGSHDLGVALVFEQRAADAIPILFSAYELYEQPTYRLRALSDLGLALTAVGHFRAAESAYRLVLEGPATPQMRANTTLELIELASLTRNRFAFQQWQNAVLPLLERLPPEFRVDYELKTGVGLARFGRKAKARRMLQATMGRAETFRLNEYVFRAERALASIVEEGEEAVKLAPIEWDRELPGVYRVASQLEALFATAPSGAGV